MVNFFQTRIMDLLLDQNGSSTIFNQPSNANKYNEQFGDGVIYDENYVEIKVY